MASRLVSPISSARLISYTFTNYVKNPVVAAFVLTALHPAYLAFLDFAFGPNADDRWVFAVSSSVIHLVLWLSINGMFEAAAYFNFWAQYKIPRLAHQVPDSALVRQAPCALIVQLLPISSFPLVSVFRN